MDPIQARKAHEKEINYYAGKSLLWFLALNFIDKLINHNFIFLEIIDEIMEEDDYNKDGYLSYLEYVMARRRDSHEEQRVKVKSKN